MFNLYCRRLKHWQACFNEAVGRVTILDTDAKSSDDALGAIADRYGEGQQAKYSFTVSCNPARVSRRDYHVLQTRRIGRRMFREPP